MNEKINGYLQLGDKNVEFLDKAIEYYERHKLEFKGSMANNQIVSKIVDIGLTHDKAYMKFIYE